jgi:hypothetical protein
MNSVEDGTGQRAYFLKKLAKLLDNPMMKNVAFRMEGTTIDASEIPVITTAVQLQY